MLLLSNKRNFINLGFKKLKNSVDILVLLGYTSGKVGKISFQKPKRRSFCGFARFIFK